MDARMASSDYVDQWMSGRPDDEAYVTRALQMSFSEDNSTFDFVNFPGSLLGPETSPSPPLPKVQRHVAGGLVGGGTGKPGAGRVSKRKPRASKKRSQTTFIAADPANFRQMVQQVTGVNVAGDWGGPSLVVKPAPQRLPGGLHALDTSSFLMGGHRRPYPGHVLHQQQGEEVAPTNGPGGYNGLEAFSGGYPTLDSWKVIT